MIQINEKKCTGCKICYNTCPSGIIEMKNKKAYVAHPEICISCNQCVAVCPVKAVENTDYSKKDYAALLKRNISFKEFNGFAAGRRSIRQYKNKKIDRSILLDLVKSTSLVPTGANAQELEYLVIDDEKTLNQIKVYMLSKALFLRKTIKVLSPVLSIFIKKRLIKKVILNLDIMAERSFSKDTHINDRILRNAPALIIIHSKRKISINFLDAGIAGYHINLAAESLGLSTCWIGYHSIMAAKFKKLSSISLVPKENTVLATIAIGYKQYDYYTGCARKNIKIKFNGEGV